MAGKPIERKLLAAIAKDGGWERVFERIAEGETQTAVAEGYGVSQGFFSRIMGLTRCACGEGERCRVCQGMKVEERRLAFREAKRVSAQSYADEAKKLVDEVPADRDAVLKVKEQVSVRQWLASKYDRETFGESAPGVTIQIGQLHLDALRQRVMVEGLPEPPKALPAPESG